MNLDVVRRLIVRLVAPLQRSVRLMISRAVVTLVDDALKCQGVQVELLAGELAAVEHFMPYGLTSRVGPGAEALFLAVGGSRSGGVVIAAQHREFRPRNLAEYEVALYNRYGALVKLLAGPAVAVEASSITLGAGATKGVARIGDTVRVTIPAGTLIGTNGGGPLTTTVPILVDGTITSSSATVKGAD